MYSSLLFFIALQTNQRSSTLLQDQADQQTVTVVSCNPLVFNVAPLTTVVAHLARNLPLTSLIFQITSYWRRSSQTPFIDVAHIAVSPLTSLSSHYTRLGRRSPHIPLAFDVTDVTHLAMLSPLTSLTVDVTHSPLYSPLMWITSHSTRVWRH